MLDLGVLMPPRVGWSGENEVFVAHWLGQVYKLFLIVPIFLRSLSMSIVF